MEMGLIVMIMNKVAKFIMQLAMCLAGVTVSAQKKSDPAGSLTYCLPSTVISLEVEAVQEKFYAGPYARYAEKYLGIKARQKDETTFQLTEIKMTPYVEADQSKRYSLAVNKGVIDASFLKLSASGLVSFGDAAHGNQVAWRFPTETSGDFSDKGVSSNITSILQPSSLSASAAIRASFTIRPVATIVTSLPSFKRTPLPSSNL